MSNHTARLTWPPADQPPAIFTYNTYPRDHTVVWGTGTATRLSAAKEYRGNAALPNPEELLVGALSSCHMLTFLAVAARRGLVVTSYTDEAAGTLAKDPNGVMCITEVVLRPVVTFATLVDTTTLAELHHLSHEQCFIANSVKMPVRVG